MLSKQRYYRVLERVQSNNADYSQYTNLVSSATYDERKLLLDQVPCAWVGPWRNLGIEIEHVPESDLYWYDVEVLRFLNQYGAKYFSNLDIWDVNWEAKRILALDKGFEKMPNLTIVDPRNLEQ